MVAQFANGVFQQSFVLKAAATQHYLLKLCLLRYAHNAVCQRIVKPGGDHTHRKGLRYVRQQGFIRPVEHDLAARPSGSG